ncbi:MAG: hypothetical protein E4H36_04785 [Spirochaetales bacterium]|nr:MAG: hypothetical protein E4H36_04785 [Spirochaetales bacterium]
MAYDIFDPKKIYRYNRKKDTYYVDIALDYYKDIYDEWDFSPVRNRDLDKELIEYLEECSHEIPLKAKIEIYFHLPEKLQDEEKERESIQGFRHFFKYSYTKLVFQRRRFLWSTVMYAAFGLCLLVGGFLIQDRLPETTSLRILSLIPEGLYIGAWVLIWEVFSIIFFEYRNHRRSLLERKRLASARIVYIYEEKPVP